MNTLRLTRYPSSIVLVAYILFALLLGACQPVAVSPGLPPEQATVPPIPEQPPTAAPTPTAAARPSPEASGEITLDLSGVARDQTVETVAAVPASAGGPYWEILPQHHRITLQGYPVTDHLLQPQFFAYPVASLAEYNEAAGDSS